MAKPFNSEVSRQGKSDVLKVTIQPSGSLIINQDSMAYMDDGLQMKVTLGNAGLSGALMRGVTGSSATQTSVTNPTQVPLKIYVSPPMQSSIAEVRLKQGDSWNFADKTFIACSPNLKVSGSVGMKNIKLMFAGENATYVSVSAPSGDGIVWVSAYGGYEVHKIRMGVDPGLVINHGCFLGMLTSSQGINYWSDYVKVGSTNGMLQAMMTDTGLVMKIKDSVPPKRQGVSCFVLTQRLNQSHFEEYIHNISTVAAKKLIGNSSSPQPQSIKREAISGALGMFGLGRKTRRNRTT